MAGDAACGLAAAPCGGAAGAALVCAVATLANRTNRAAVLAVAFMSTHHGPREAGPTTLTIILERNLAIVLPQEVQEALVVTRLHVEQPRHDLVVAARLLEATADH